MFSLPRSFPRNTIADAIRWWVDELVAMVPGRHAPNRAVPLEIVRLAEGFVLVSRQGRSGPVPWQDALVLARRTGRRNRSVKLTFDEQLCLVRSSRIPAAARAKVAEILALETGRLTPFRPGEICSGWRVIESEAAGSLLVEQAILKRGLLAPLIADLLAAGFQRIVVSCRLHDGGEIPVSIPSDLLRGGPVLLKAIRVAIRAVAFSLAIGLCLCLGLAFVRQQSEIARLETEIATAQPRAVAVRRQYDEGLRLLARSAALRTARASDPTVLGLLEEITHLLPDSVWITDLEIDQSSVRIAGFGQSVAGLIGELDRSPLFQDVRFASPVVRAPREEAERFNIALRLPAAAPAVR